MYVNCPWLLTLLCHLKCLLKTALHPPEIRLNRITPCYVTFLLPATSAVCAQHFVDRVVANFIAVSQRNIEDYLPFGFLSPSDITLGGETVFTDGLKYTIILYSFF
jgi:hypothetical protein